MVDALDEMKEMGIRPRIYVNHRGGTHMVRNLGGPWGYYQERDSPESSAYCLDLLLAHGIRYFWTDTMYESEKFGDGGTWPSEKARETAEKSYNAKRVMKGRTDNHCANIAMVAKALGVKTEADIRHVVFDNLFLPVTMHDGNRVLGIKRYRGEYSPDAGSFACQVSAARLDKLIECEAAVVVYQHFGIWRAQFADTRPQSAHIPATLPSAGA